MLNVTTHIDKLDAQEEIKTLMSAVGEIREFFGLTRQAFALLCDIPAHSYRVLEKHGKGDIVTFYKILRILHSKYNIDINVLLTTKSYSTALIPEEFKEERIKQQNAELASKTSHGERIESDKLLRNDA
jgi:hypothetical protein